MTVLTNNRIKIYVNEPFEWSYEPLYGSITSFISDTEALVKLDETFKGKTLTSDQLLVMTRYQGYSLRTLSYDTTITVIGALTDSTNNFDFILIGDFCLRNFRAFKVLTGNYLYDNIAKMDVSIWELNYDCMYEIDVADGLLSNGQKPEYPDGSKVYMIRYDNAESWTYSGVEPFGGQTLEEAIKTVEQVLPSKVIWRN